jgi:hypothetical protein
MTAEFEAKLYSRYPPEERPPKLRSMPSSTNKYDRSLLRAIHAAYWRRFWIAGFLRCVAAVTPTFSAFITRAILSWLTSVHTFHTANDADRAQVSSLLHVVTLYDLLSSIQMDSPRGAGYGIGLAFALFVMQEVTSLVTSRSFERLLQCSRTFSGSESLCHQYVTSGPQQLGPTHFLPSYHGVRCNHPYSCRHNVPLIHDVS